ncbi:MAG: DUF2085 domain-containing protein [Anaerolineales bacterium]
MITVALYTKDNCSLCDQAAEDLKEIQEKIPHNLALVNVEEDADLKAAYTDRVPVLQVGPYTLESPFDRQKIEMTLGAAQDRLKQVENDPKYKERKECGSRVSRGETAGVWFSRHYLAVVNLFLFLYVGLPFLAPVLMNAGYPGAARPIYTVYGAVCHQMAFRSWFLFGEQPVYPRSAANVEGLTPYGAATGLDEESLLDARRFIGNEQLGYKVAFCQRDVAIYGSMLLFGLIYAASGRRLRPLHWVAWIVIGIAPIALDGFSQLLSQIPAFEFIPYRESTPLLRTLTGSLFGFTTAWFGMPLLEETAAENRVVIAAKKVRLTNHKKSS